LIWQKLEPVSSQCSSFLQSIKETETGFVKLGLTGETVCGPGFAG